MTLLDVVYQMLRINWPLRSFIREDALKGLAEAGAILRRNGWDNPVN